MVQKCSTWIFLLHRQCLWRHRFILILESTWTSKYGFRQNTYLWKLKKKKHVKAEDGLCPYRYFERKVHFSTVGSSECSSPKQSRLGVHPPPPHAHNSTTSSSLSPLSTVTNTLSWWCTRRNPQYLFIQSNVATVLYITATSSMQLRATHTLYSTTNVKWRSVPNSPNVPLATYWYHDIMISTYMIDESCFKSWPFERWALLTRNNNRAESGALSDVASAYYGSGHSRHSPVYGPI